MLDDYVAEIWDRFRYAGELTRSANPDDWQVAHEGQTMEDLQTLASAQGLEIVESDEAMWLVATPGSRYAKRPSDIWRGNAPSEVRSLASYVVLIVLSRLLDPGDASHSGFVDVEGAIRHVDDWADGVVSSESSTGDARRVADVWRQKPLSSDGLDEDQRQRRNARSKTGIVRYAFAYLVEEGLLRQLKDERWGITARLAALWERQALTSAFASRLKERGIELEVGDYA